MDENGDTQYMAMGNSISWLDNYLRNDVSKEFCMAKSTIQQWIDWWLVRK